MKRRATHDLLLLHDIMMSLFLTQASTTFLLPDLDRSWFVDTIFFASSFAAPSPPFPSRLRSPATYQLPGSMGGTYVANAVACASAIATVQVLRDENLLENATVRGRQLKNGIVQLSGGTGCVLGNRFPFKDLRGLGLMVGLELEAPQGSGVAAAVTQACLKRGMILLTCSSYETVRFIPPLNVSETEMAEGLQIFEDAVTEVFG